MISNCKHLKMRLNRFTETFQGLASAVTARQVREYLQGLKRKNGKPVSNRTRRNFQTVINSLFHFGRMRRYVVRDVVDEICEIGSPIAPFFRSGGIFTLSASSRLREPTDKESTP